MRSRKVRIAISVRRATLALRRLSAMDVVIMRAQPPKNWPKLDESAVAAYPLQPATLAGPISTRLGTFPRNSPGDG
jgi:hypothetical protein